MREPILLSLGAYNSDPGEEFLVENDAFIQAEARRAAPLDLEPDELAQNIRIKVWSSRRKHAITYARAYIRKAARTTVVDMVRRQRSGASLSRDEDGESCLGDSLVAQNEGFRDPAYEIEAGEIDADLLGWLIEVILALPPRQRHAMLLFFKEHRDDVLPLIYAFEARGIDVEAINQPKDACDVFLLRASLSVARKKLRHSLKAPATS